MPGRRGFLVEEYSIVDLLDCGMSSYWMAMLFRSWWANGWFVLRFACGLVHGLWAGASAKAVGVCVALSLSSSSLKFYL